MNWYIAKLVFKITSETHISAQPKFDEQLRLIMANTEEIALQKALLIGKKEEELSVLKNDGSLKKEFVNLTELFRINEPEDGMELYYNIREVNNADQYIATTNQKARLLEVSIN